MRVSACAVFVDVDVDVDAFGNLQPLLRQLGRRNLPGVAAQDAVEFVQPGV